VPAAVMRQLEHIGPKVGARGEQACLRERLDVAGEQDGAAPGARPEHQRCVVHVRAVLRIDVARRLPRPQYLQDPPWPAQSLARPNPCPPPSPTPVPPRPPASRRTMSNAQYGWRLGPTATAPTHRRSRAAPSPPMWSACRWLITIRGPAVTPRRRRHPSTAPA